MAMRGRVRGWLKQLGPGLITGAADDDPSGIATYSQAGAQFGFLTLWTIVFTYPLMVGIQLISARIGRVTGHELRGEGRVYGGGLHKIEPAELARISAVSFAAKWPELVRIPRRGRTASLFDAD